MSDLIVLPGATSTQGIARGVNSTFYAGDMWLGHIYRSSLRRRTAELFIQAPEGRLAMGLCADVRHELLFVGGGLGWAYVYDIETGPPSPRTRSGRSTILEGRDLWVVQNWVHQVSKVRLAADLRSGTVEKVITHDALHFPTTAIPFDNQLAVVNAKLDTAGPDHHPTADQYEIVIIDR